MRYTWCIYYVGLHLVIVYYACHICVLKHLAVFIYDNINIHMYPIMHLVIKILQM